MIHPTAVIDPKAELHPSVVVGPYAVIDSGVTVGEECRIGPHVYLTGNTTIGARNQFHAGAAIGDTPQDLNYKGAATGLRIGDDNVFREYMTVHCAAKEGEHTVIGSHNFLMACSHVGHNCQLGDHIILANGAGLGGYVVVEDKANFSATCIVHQFVRIGTLALMQGGSAISKDLPPFTVARGDNAICGLNVIGLRRAGLTAEERLELKRLYRALFRGGLPLRQAVAAARQEFQSAHAVRLLDFIAASKRGVCTHSGVEPRDESE